MTRSQANQNLRETGVPAAIEYKEAFEALQDAISVKQRRLLVAHARSAQQTGSIQELMVPSLCETVEEAENEYVLLGRAIASHLEFRPDHHDLPDRLKPILALATPTSLAGGSFREWTLRPEVAEALHNTKL